MANRLLFFPYEPFLKPLITVLLLVYVLAFWPQGIWDQKVWNAKSNSAPLHWAKSQLLTNRDIPTLLGAGGGEVASRTDCGLGKDSLLGNCVGKTGSAHRRMKRNFTLHCETKMDLNTSIKTQNYKTLRRKHGGKLYQTGFGKALDVLQPKSAGNKSKNRQIELHQT